MLYDPTTTRKLQGQIKAQYWRLPKYNNFQRYGDQNGQTSLRKKLEIRTINTICQDIRIYVSQL
jgi:hypothetical protein